MTKNINFYKASIPNLFTISAFIFGFNAIKLAIAHNITGAIYFVIIASILDLFDGRVARMLGVNSKFGAELDSLSDLICFGIATSFIVLFYVNPYSNTMFFSVCFFSVCSMLRLARYNVNSDEVSPKYESYNYFFSGIPTPAGAMLATFPIALDLAFVNTPLALPKISAELYTFYIILIGFLMISTLPTPSTKGLNISKRYMPLMLAASAFFIMCFINFTWATIALFDVLYILGILIIFIILVKNKFFNRIQNKK